jgi:hypothetical protein
MIYPTVGSIAPTVGGLSAAVRRSSIVRTGERIRVHNRLVLPEFGDS